MGEVFLALDTRLDRQVAIKALPEHLAHDADRLARFQREAKALAALNHPCIGAIHGLEEFEGRQFLVLEFVAGQTLTERLAKGAMPVSEALHAARQIAEALEAAHEKGVVHRDLKPSNVMVTPHGEVKVLDFGLARMDDGPSSPSAAQGLANSPTITSPVPQHSPTVPGVIMGTAGYMSPERARGKTVDRRSDIFSFGCVLYEMLTGMQPFRGETVADSIGATLHKAPDFALLPPETPQRVRELLETCLAKERRSRLQDMGDARLALERAIAGHEWSSAVHVPGARRGPMRAALAVFACAALLGAGWFAATLLGVRTAAPGGITFHVSTAIPATPAYGFLADLAPDGTFLIHQAWPTRPPESTKPSGALVVRRLDRDETRVLDGTEGATNAAISPDGRWLAFVAAQERSSRSHALRRIALTDGQPTGMVETLCTVPGTGGDICWVSDQEIALASAWDSTILVIPASGGEPRVALREENTSSGLENWGGISRVGDGKSILATRWTVAGDRVKERVELIDLAAGRKSDLLPGVSGALVIPGDGGSGILVASRNQSSLVAAPFDLATARVMGTPVTVWSGPALRGFRLSANGVLALSTESTDRSGRQLAFVDDAGEAKPLSSPARAYGPISLSPDGSKVAMMMESNEAVPPLEVWIHDLERRTFTCLKTPGIPIGPCAWTRDGLRVTYGAVSEAEVAIWEQPVNGAGEATKVYAYSGNGTLLFPVTWSPDGAVLALMQIDMASGRSGTLLLERTPGSREWTARTFTNPRANSTQMMFSPDMRWVALTSAEAGDTELYVQRYTGADSLQGSAPAERHQISNSGASSTLWWSADGKEIRYIGGDWQVMSVAITTEPQFAAAVPKVVASLKGVKTTSQAFAPDGRLMVVLRGENEQVAHIDLALNFMPELRARMAQAK